MEMLHHLFECVEISSAKYTTTLMVVDIIVFLINTYPIISNNISALYY